MMEMSLLMSSNKKCSKHSSK
uniref:Uncharacterized protein n=1 Tax=Rhizophora mucronata TaxID=61149 RepID=A0A2P2KRA9_RHIMU